MDRMNFYLEMNKCACPIIWEVRVNSMYSKKVNIYCVLSFSCAEEEVHHSIFFGVSCNWTQESFVKSYKITSLLDVPIPIKRVLVLFNAVTHINVFESIVPITLFGKSGPSIQVSFFKENRLVFSCSFQSYSPLPDAPPNIQ